MKADFDVDTSKLKQAAKNAVLTADDLLEIGYTGSAVVKQSQVTKVPVDTGATRSSINDHIATSTRTYFEDDIGPETEYAPNIEYGRKDMPNYPIQPFVRPSAHGQNRADALNAIARTFGLKVASKWQK